MQSETVLKSLQTIAVKFMAYIGQRKKIPQNIIDGAGGLIFPFGSYRLGVHGPGQSGRVIVVVFKRCSSFQAPTSTHSSSARDT